MERRSFSCFVQIAKPFQWRRNQARSQVLCWGGAKQAISGLNQWCSQDNTCMYGRAHTARCRVCMKSRKLRERCTPPAQLGGSALESGFGAQRQHLLDA